MMFIKFELHLEYGNTIDEKDYVVLNVNFISKIGEEYDMEDKKWCEVHVIVPEKTSYTVLGSREQVKKRIDKVVDRMLNPLYLYDGDKKTLKMLK